MERDPSEPSTLISSFVDDFLGVGIGGAPTGRLVANFFEVGKRDVSVGLLEPTFVAVSLADPAQGNFGP